MSINWPDFGIYNWDGTHAPDWAHVVSLGDGGGYEWTTLHAFWSPTARRYFWASGSGCSCNSWGDGLSSESDFENGAKADLQRAIRAFAETYRYAIAAVDALDATANVARFDEADHA